MPEKPKRIFRKSAFGGFRSDDVMNYIISSEQEISEALNLSKKEKNQLLEEINNLKAELSLKNTEITALNSKNTEIKNMLSVMNEELKSYKEASEHQKLRQESIAELEIAAGIRAEKIISNANVSANDILDAAKQQENEISRRVNAIKENFSYKVKLASDNYISVSTNILNMTKASAEQLDQMLMKLDGLLNSVAELANTDDNIETVSKNLEETGL